MPSKKKVSQRVRGIAQLCAKSQTPISGDSPLSHGLSNQEKVHAHHQTSAQTSDEVVKRIVTQAVVDGSKPLLRSASQKSVSTDEGSSSSGCSSGASPLSSEGLADFPPHCEHASSNPDVQEPAHEPPSDLAVHVCNHHFPLWVGNGETGDAAAWLLVLPKSPQHVPKSPQDAVILGPYVTMKNTFLDESRVGGAMMFQRPSRARSMGARC